MKSKPEPPERFKWFPNDFWKRPEPLKDKGAKSVDDIYQAMGYALNKWELAEEELANFFTVLSEANSSRSLLAVRRAYGSIVSNAGRRTAIEAVADTYFGSHLENPKIKIPFDGLIENIGRASKRRDDIAHGKAIRLAVQAGQKTIDHGAFLFPPDYNTERTNAFLKARSHELDFTPITFMRAKYRFTDEDILSYAEKFSQLQDAIWNFTRTVTKRDGVIPVLAE